MRGGSAWSPRTARPPRPARGSPPSGASSRCEPARRRGRNPTSGRAGGAVRGAGRAPGHALGRRAELDPQPGDEAAARAVPAETAAHSAPRGLPSRAPGPRSARKAPSWGSASQRVSSKVSARAQLLTREPLLGPERPPGKMPAFRGALPLAAFTLAFWGEYRRPAVRSGVTVMPTTTLADVPRGLPSGVSANVGTRGLHGSWAVRLEKRLPTPCCFIPEPALVAPPPASNLLLLQGMRSLC